MLYEGVILETPTELEKTEGKLGRILTKVETFLAKDGESARSKMLIINATDIKDIDPDRVEVLIRPFV